MYTNGVLNCESKYTAWANSRCSARSMRKRWHSLKRQMHLVSLVGPLILHPRTAFVSFCRFPWRDKNILYQLIRCLYLRHDRHWGRQHEPGLQQLGWLWKQRHGQWRPGHDGRKQAVLRSRIGAGWSDKVSELLLVVLLLLRLFLFWCIRLVGDW